MSDEQVRGDFAQVPYNAEPGQDFQRVEGNVHFPPKKALTRGSHEVMMVVVPAFAEGQQRQQPIVLAGVRGFVADRTKKVRKRINSESVVPEKHGAQAEAPNKERPPAN